MRLLVNLVLKNVFWIIMFMTVLTSCDSRSGVLELEGDLFVVITEGELTPNAVVNSTYTIYLATTQGKYAVTVNAETTLVNFEKVYQVFQGGRYRVSGNTYTPDIELMETPVKGGEFLGFLRASKLEQLGGDVS